MIMKLRILILINLNNNFKRNGEIFFKNSNNIYMLCKKKKKIFFFASTFLKPVGI